jgi:SAM-dependent methyltransferase
MKAVISKPPYTLLARFYDHMTRDAAGMNRHVRRKLLSRILSRARVVCDLGCGTGTTSVELARQGCKVYAVDASPEQCRQARRKIRRAGVRVQVKCEDMRRLRLPEPVDLVLCEFNPINHLPRKSDLDPAFRAIARALKAGGWFYFDLNMRPTYRHYYSLTHWEEGPGFCVVFHGGWKPRRNRAWMQCEWFVREGRVWRRYRERLEDTWWSDGEIRRALRRAGFVRIRAWDGARVRPRAMKPRSGFDRYYLAQKPPCG